MKKMVAAGFAALVLAVTGACAGDDADVDANLGDDTEESAQTDDSVTEYCEFSAELDARGERPSDEDFDHIIEVAPEEIKDDVETLVAAIRAGDEGNAEAQAAGTRLEAWEDDNCPEDAGDADAGAGDADGSGGGDAEEPASGEPGDAGGEDSSGEGSGDEGEGGADAEVEAEVDGGGEGGTDTTH